MNTYDCTRWQMQYLGTALPDATLWSFLIAMLPSPVIPVSTVYLSKDIYLTKVPTLPRYYIARNLHLVACR